VPTGHAIVPKHSANQPERASARFLQRLPDGPQERLASVRLTGAMVCRHHFGC